MIAIIGGSKGATQWGVLKVHYRSKIIGEKQNMAISEFEIKRCEKAIEKFMVKHRPPAHIRSKLDLGSRIKNQSVELFEIRPQWDNPSKKIEIPVAKTTYVKRQEQWKIYWQRSDLKWHVYEPLPTVRTLEEFLSAVGEDRYHCFFG